MSRSNRLSFIAGFLGALLLIFGGSLAFAISDNEAVAQKVQTNPEKKQDRAEPSSPTASKHDKQQPTAYKPNCKEPKNAEEADLCEQGRMAKAAEDLLDRTDAQIKLSKYEIGGLLASLIFTGLAAFAAVIAARAARDSVRVANDTAEKQLRAYVIPQQCSISGGAQDVIAEVTVINCGQTPAHRVVIHAYRIIADRPIGALVMPVSDNWSRKGVLASGATTRVEAGGQSATKKEIAELNKNRRHVYVKCWVDYTDIFERRWSQSFEFLSDNEPGRPLREWAMTPSNKYFPERMVSEKDEAAKD